MRQSALWFGGPPAPSLPHPPRAGRPPSKAPEAGNPRQSHPGVREALPGGREEKLHPEGLFCKAGGRRGAGSPHRQGGPSALPFGKGTIHPWGPRSPMQAAGGALCRHPDPPLLRRVRAPSPPRRPAASAEGHPPAARNKLCPRRRPATRALQPGARRCRNQAQFWEQETQPAAYLPAAGRAPSAAPRALQSAVRLPAGGGGAGREAEGGGGTGGRASAAGRGPGARATSV